MQFRNAELLQDECRHNTRCPNGHGQQCGGSVPSPDEQATIADFLDRETMKIDTLLAKKRTLIDRLVEKRRALISRTVTRGLPPDAARGFARTVCAGRQFL